MALAVVGCSCPMISGSAVSAGIGTSFVRAGLQDLHFPFLDLFARAVERSPSFALARSARLTLAMNSA